MPKTGDFKNAASWRPIAILPVCYKVFAKVLHHRLRAILEPKISEDEMGFMPGRGCDEALLVLEMVVQMSLDQHMPLWLASLDLSKAFDRVEWPTLFQALGEMGVPIGYQHLLGLMYDGQTGTLRDQNSSFDIRRGVRQGDVLSPLLFNTAMELVMKRWQARLHRHGIKLNRDGPDDRLRSVRFADDIIIYANSLTELTQMIDILCDELRTAGLEFNTKKSRIFTLDEGNAR